MRRFLIFLLSLIFFLLLIICVNTLRFQSKQSAPLSQRLNYPVDKNALQHLSEAIQIPTVSYDEGDVLAKSNNATFDSLIVFLKATYPLTFEKLSDTIINHRSLLLHWRIENPASKPVILYAHLDVVPADSLRWKRAPFNGEITGDSVYGRGAIDDKGSVISIMEAVERLLKTGFTPKRDVYIALGQDEEAGGEEGAKMIAAFLESKGVKAEFLLDEGGLIATDMVPFVKPPVAMIFTSEKGYATIELSVKTAGGHSSRPPAQPPVEILAAAITKINQHPFETRYSESVEDFMNYTGPEMRLPFKALFANRWLFGPIITGEYKKIPSAAAMLRTTSVTTVINGGNKENVVPSFVSAKINFRLLPGDYPRQIYERIKILIDDERVELTLQRNWDEPSKVSSSGSPSFKLLTASINKVFPDAIVAPSLLIAQTDSRHFRRVTENIYRFLPVRMDDKTLDTMHGIDERIGVNDFMEAITFYETLLKQI